MTASRRYVRVSTCMHVCVFSRIEICSPLGVKYRKEVERLLRIWDKSVRTDHGTDLVEGPDDSFIYQNYFDIHYDSWIVVAYFLILYLILAYRKKIRFFLLVLIIIQNFERSYY